MLRRSSDREKPPSRTPAPKPVESNWTDEKARAILGAFNTLLHNQGRKYGVPPSEVADLIRDHLLDPEGD